MRIILSVLAVAAPAGASFFAHAPAAIAHAVAALPDPATAALMAAGIGLVAGARRARSAAVAD